MATQSVFSVRSLRRLSVRARQSLVLGASGVMLLYVVGFAPMAVMHNAAHDTRHAVVFPCH